MTRSVLSVSPEMPVVDVARLLVEHGISAVPVTRNGVPLGVVSETDLICHGKTQHRENGWLTTLLKSNGPLQVQRILRADLTAADVMTSPAITVNESAALDDVLQLMVTHSLKRLPVVSEGRVSGIISRVDLLRAFARRASFNKISSTDSAMLRHEAANDTKPAIDDAGAISAAAFRGAVANYKHHLAEAVMIERHHEAAVHDREIAEWLDKPLTNDYWRDMLIRARSAADLGLMELEILRFPCGVCSDGGRSINNTEVDWAATLRGMPAEVWRRWRDELYEKGFKLSGRIIDFPNGMPGRAALFLSWGKW
jgi:CBS domain-containing protein